VQYQQSAMMCDELRQSFAFFPRRPEPRIWISKPSESSVNEFIRGRSLHSGALSIERPAKYELRRTIVFSSNSSQPMVDERRFSNSAPGNNCNNIDLLVGPCIVQESNVLFTTKDLASSNGQSSY